MARSPASSWSIATKTTVAPSLRNVLAWFCSASAATPSSVKKFSLPSATRFSPTVPRIPLPAGALKSVIGRASILRSAAAATIAAANGCSLARSTLAASWRRVRSSNPCAGVIATTFGLPSVSVPVLSTTSVSTVSMRSRTSASLINMPNEAARPTPTMIDIGVARPSAQGQAMIRTLTAATSA